MYLFKMYFNQSRILTLKKQISERKPVMTAGANTNDIRTVRYAGKFVIFTTLAVLSCILVLLLGGCANIKSTKHYEDGKRYVKSEQYDKAVEEFELTLKYSPNHDQALEALGLVYGKLGMCEKALPYFEKAYSLKPEDKLYVTNLAVTYEKTQRFPEAKKAYKKLLAIDKDNELAKSHFKELEEKGY